MSSVTIADVQAAEQRIQPFIKNTPVYESQLLNDWLGHNIMFKAECLQKTGAFKLRGAINMMLKARENGQLGSHVLASSSGNHAQAVAYAAKLLGVKATIFSAQNVSKVKAAATEYYGAKLDISASRKEADEKVAEAAKKNGVLWMPPFNHYDIIAGQGTAALEALKQTGEVDSVFAPVGGGGLISGSLVTTKALYPKASVIGAEPLVANDAIRSIRTGVIQSLENQPDTLADGAATLAVGELTFPFLQALDGFYEIDETKIAYWTQWLQHLLKIHVEPTSAMSMGAVVEWLKTQSTKQKVLVILSGGNIDQQKMLRVWQDDHLHQVPSLLI
ncbi:serine/threonine dehydratase [uncultured Paraglaciecola sp.]|uniref:serine/threonine dehydratase n=1 Tax=uncultured Paraglaciecola sp. TaxID=1765024 RepID=UPI0026216913|nr:serine/threonine dehydratase [uncultured Paraglaciecola sp.]